MRKKILIVEDDNAIQERLTALLTDEGFETTSAYNGQEGLNTLKVQTPDLVLLDLMMPVKDGYDFRFEQLKDIQWAKIPVVVMSAISNILPAQKLLKVQTILQKPFDLDVLLKTVREHIHADA